MQVEDFDRLAGDLEPCDFPRGFVMAKAGEAISHAYFMDAGIGSVIGTTFSGSQAEVGLFGDEGAAPVELVLGSELAVHDIVVQVAGAGWRLARQPFTSALEASAGLRLLMMRFVQTLSTQTAQTAVSNAVHTVDERLARWILMCDDRVRGDLALTHEYISVMLAVRRPSVTTAIHVLEGRGFIRAERGCIIIRDRSGLDEFTREAYGKPEAEYARLIGTMLP